MKQPTLLSFRPSKYETKTKSDRSYFGPGSLLCARSHCLNKINYSQKFHKKPDSIGSHYGLRHSQHAGKTMGTCLLIEDKKKNAAKLYYSIAMSEWLQFNTWTNYRLIFQADWLI